SVADANWPRILVTAKMIQRDFLEIASAVHAVHDLQRTSLGVIAEAARYPVNKRVRFVDEAYPDDRIQRECRIPQPGEPIIPISHPSNTFRQGKCGRGDQRAMLTANKQLQRQSRTMDHLSPPPLVLRL